MKRLQLFGTICALAFSLFIVARAAENEAAPEIPRFNQLVLQIAGQYPVDGTHGYWWPKGDEPQYDGASEDLYFQGQKVMSGEPNRQTYCCGLTLEIFLKAYTAWLEKNAVEHPPVKAEDWKEFQRLWFVEEVNGPGPSAALEKFSIGRAVPASEVVEGDFVQLWRTPNRAGKTSGHSVVFLNWIYNESGKIVGLRYWSTQTSTDGIHENSEYFGPLGGLSTENTHYARVDMDEWLKSSVVESLK